MKWQQVYTVSWQKSTVCLEILHYNSDSTRINDNSYIKIKDLNLPPCPGSSASSSPSESPAPLPPLPPTAPITPPKKKSPCGCFVVAFIIFILVCIIISNSSESKNENTPIEQTTSEEQ